MSTKSAPDNLVELTATEIVSGVNESLFSAEDVARACLARIEQRDPLILAWETVDADLALAGARRIDQITATKSLQGVPFGVKDVIDCAGLPTQMGSPLYINRSAWFDAGCVAQARMAGAVALGKTVTAEFAGTAPTRTKNPHNIDHTPGGSSSGSAAAVADCMIPVAFGTQTGGSVIRPASFCGIFGFKPTYGMYSTAGIKPAAESLDTVGLMARSLDDIELFHSILINDSTTLNDPFEDAPRVGVCLTHLWETADHDTTSVMENTVTRLTNAGARLSDKELPGDAQRLTAERAIINAYERAHGLTHEWHGSRDQLSTQIIKTCETGLSITGAQYVAALQFVDNYRRLAIKLFEDVDILLTPAVPGEAPLGHEYAGDPRFQELWTLLRFPVITLPTHRGKNDLPIGIQLVAPWYKERELFAISRWVLQNLQHSS